MIAAIEGGDASGKKTQSQILTKYYGDEGVCLSFPRYDGPFGDLILRSLKRESVMYRRRIGEDGGAATYQYDAKDDTTALRGLFTLDQYEAAPLIRKYDSEGKVVVLDRYWPSNTCYGAEDGFDPDVLTSLSSSLPEADIYFYIDVSVEEAAKRRPVPRDRYEKDKAKLERVRKRYLDLWHKNMKPDIAGERLFIKGPLWVMIDGHQERDAITSQLISWISLVRAANRGGILIEARDKQARSQLVRKS